MQNEAAPFSMCRFILMPRLILGVFVYNPIIKTTSQKEGHPVKISARNQIKGKIVSIDKGLVNAIVVIDIGGGNKISSNISVKAVEELGLAAGMDAYAVIKASSVMVGVDD